MGRIALYRVRRGAQFRLFNLPDDEVVHSMCHLNLLSLVLNLLSEGCQPQILVRMSRDSVTMLLIDIGKLLL